MEIVWLDGTGTAPLSILLSLLTAMNLLPFTGQVTTCADLP
jgi:hypothetical protein